MPRIFDNLILDEAHEEKLADSAQGNAVGAALHASVRHTRFDGTAAD
jgi:hypothetical protein